MDESNFIILNTEKFLLHTHMRASNSKEESRDFYVYCISDSGGGEGSDV